MGCRVWDVSGGIQGLCQLLREHGEAIEFDLITLGLRLDNLGSRALSWRDLGVVVRHLPVDSALARSLRGSASQYSATDYLIVNAVNILQNMSWQLGNDPKAKKPEPVLLPGMVDETKPRTLWSGSSQTIEEMNALLGGSFVTT